MPSCDVAAAQPAHPTHTCLARPRRPSLPCPALHPTPAKHVAGLHSPRSFLPGALHGCLCKSNGIRLGVGRVPSSCLPALILPVRTPCPAEATRSFAPPKANALMHSRTAHNPSTRQATGALGRPSVLGFSRRIKSGPVCGSRNEQLMAALSGACPPCAHFYPQGFPQGHVFVARVPGTRPAAGR